MPPLSLCAWLGPPETGFANTLRNYFAIHHHRPFLATHHPMTVHATHHPMTVHATHPITIYDTCHVLASEGVWRDAFHCRDRADHKGRSRKDSEQCKTGQAHDSQVGTEERDCFFGTRGKTTVYGVGLQNL
jgi:hypothetical protein